MNRVQREIKLFRLTHQGHGFRYQENEQGPMLYCAECRVALELEKTEDDPARGGS